MRLQDITFFFQAEDGIRDGHVTGVQTCALPISDDAEGPLDAGIFTDEGGRLNAIIDVSNVEEVKGLEFDHVTVVNPEEIINRSPLGVNDLYVALTRATQTLTIVGHWPEEFH